MYVLYDRGEKVSLLFPINDIVGSQITLIQAFDVSILVETVNTKKKQPGTKYTSFVSIKSKNMEKRFMYENLSFLVTSYIQTS